jgi:oligopeptide/dipeptide ABC transporter ATP-binding protein
MIAMALSCQPKILLADEPTTALDVTIQAQILDLMQELQDKFGTAMILITHDLGIVAEKADRIAVMYAGKIVEYAGVEDLFAHPSHPYTLGLLASIPRLDAASNDAARPRLNEIEGSVPSLLELPPGCTFAARCPYATATCRADYPPLEEKAPDHWAACWHSDRLPRAAHG